MGPKPFYTTVALQCEKDARNGALHIYLHFHIIPCYFLACLGTRLGPEIVTLHVGIDSPGTRLGPEIVTLYVGIDSPGYGLNRIQIMD